MPGIFERPQDPAWVEFIETGFRQGLRDSAVQMVVTKWGDTGKEIQRTLVQETLESHSQVDYIVGNALMAKAAISAMRNRNLENQVGIVSTCFTPAGIAVCAGAASLKARTRSSMPTRKS